MVKFYEIVLIISLECDGLLSDDCTSCNTINTYRDDNHDSG